MKKKQVWIQFKIKHDKKGKTLTLSLNFVWFLPWLLLSGLLGALVFGYLPILYKNFQESRKREPLKKQIYVNPDIPTRLQIPAIGIDLAVKEATVSANNWQVFDNAASWLKSSGNLANGNIVIYGHNTDRILGKIIQLGVGQDIIVSSQAVKKTYKVTNVYTTYREDLSAIPYSGNRLTLYTCSGWFDANRFFVIADPITVSK